MSNHLKVPLHDFDPTGKYSKRLHKSQSFQVSCLQMLLLTLENYNEESLFMPCVFSSHDPRMAPKEYQDKYKTAKISLPKNYQPKHHFDNGELIIRDEICCHSEQKKRC